MTYVIFGIVDFLESFYGVESSNGVILGLAGTIIALGVIFALLRKGWGKVRSIANQWNVIYDTVAGSEPILDPETNEELRGERRPIGARVATLEKASLQIAEALDRLASALERMSLIEETLAKVVESQEQHEQWSHEWTKAHNEHYDGVHDQMWEAINELKTSSS